MIKSDKVECCQSFTRNVFSSFFFFHRTETPLWLLLQVAPIRNERDLVVLLLLTFRDITAFKQLIDAEDTKSGMHSIHTFSIVHFDYLLVESLMTFVTFYYFRWTIWNDMAACRFIKICKAREVSYTKSTIQCAYTNN